MPLARTARAWLEVTRLSNLPTVPINVLAGAGLALGADATLAWRPLALAMIAGALLYCAGMALNDAADVARDADSRPERPIPSGRLDRRTVWVIGGLLLGAGIAGAGAIGHPAALTAIAIALLVLAYTFTHGKHAWACVLMGGCRVGLYPLGALAVVDTWGEIPTGVLVFGAGLGLTTVLITLAARAEASATPHTKRLLAWSVVFVPLCAPLLAEPAHIRTTPSLLTAVAFALWSSWCARAAIAGKPWIAIPGWIAGFCLFDAMALAMHGQVSLAIAGGVCFAVTLAAQRVLPGS
ncbi:MAG: UbiA family prenyltransferase [Phycisphaerales bacterium JB040]